MFHHFSQPQPSGDISVEHDVPRPEAHPVDQPFGGHVMLRHVNSICCCAMFGLSLALHSTAHATTTVPYSGCGHLVPGVECPRYVGNDGVTFSITNTGKFQLGDYVSVQGAICFDCPSICQEGAVFETQSITECVGIPPTGFLFNECGTLVFVLSGGTPCLAFETGDGGLYQINNFGGFGPGDFVRVTSNQISTPCATLCGEFEACLGDNGISPCIAQPFFFDGCGELVIYDGPTISCMVFQDELGNRWLLDDQGSFELGDQLHVSGFTMFCSPLCGDVLGCITNNPPLGCLGDIDDSGEVNVFDLLAIISTWGACNDGCREDLNNDDQINVADLLIVISRWS